MASSRALAHSALDNSAKSARKFSSNFFSFDFMLSSILPCISRLASRRTQRLYPRYPNDLPQPVQGSLPTLIDWYPTSRKLPIGAWHLLLLSGRAHLIFRSATAPSGRESGLGNAFDADAVWQEANRWRSSWRLWLFSVTDSDTACFNRN